MGCQMLLTSGNYCSRAATRGRWCYQHAGRLKYLSPLTAHQTVRVGGRPVRLDPLHRYEESTVFEVGDRVAHCLTEEWLRGEDHFAWMARAHAADRRRSPTVKASRRTEWEAQRDEAVTRSRAEYQRRLEQAPLKLEAWIEKTVGWTMRTELWVALREEGDRRHILGPEVRVPGRRPLGSLACRPEGFPKSELADLSRKVAKLPVCRDCAAALKARILERELERQMKADW